MYPTLLILHSWLRWLVLLTAAFAIARALAGLRGPRAWDAGTDRSLLFFTIALDIQFLIGLILYGISPLTQAAMQDMASAMRNAGVRFFAVEHLTGMVLALIFAHVGRVQVRKAASDGAKYQRALVFTVIAVVIILASIPWPGLSAGRPLFRF